MCLYEKAFCCILYARAGGSVRWVSASPLQAVFFLNSAPTYVRAARVTLVKMGDLVPAAAGEVPVGRQRKLNPDGTPRCHSAKQ